MRRAAVVTSRVVAKRGGLNPDCCSVGWDQLCVDLAVELCGLFVYDCANPGPPNDCAVNAAVLAAGDNEAFNNTNANTDGPPTNCSYGKDLWYLVQASETGPLTVELLTPGWDSTLAIYVLGPKPTFDPNDLPYLLVGCVDVRGPGGRVLKLIDADEGFFYLVQLAGFDNGGGPGVRRGTIALRGPVNSDPCCAYDQATGPVRLPTDYPCPDVWASRATLSSAARMPATPAHLLQRSELHAEPALRRGSVCVELVVPDPLSRSHLSRQLDVHRRGLPQQ